MKNQPNKATVKGGLPTAHNALSDAYQRHGWLFQPDVLPSGACPHEKIAMEAMQEYSDQQNAELRERVKELEAGNNRILNEVNEINKLTKQTRANVTMRIIELETKNDRLCEALKKIADRFDPETQDFEGIIRIAEEELKQQEK